MQLMYGCINFATKEVANINLTLKFHLFDPLFNYERPGLYHVLNLGVNQPLRVAFFVYFLQEAKKGKNVMLRHSFVGAVIFVSLKHLIAPALDIMPCLQAPGKTDFNNFKKGAINCANDTKISSLILMCVMYANPLNRVAGYLR